ncbi:sialin-like [Lytechinus variegatus]|uniref:sialin-like n=1 Tax=Lytechinus variegatus TaxID=7654 RepID=UPI001BB11845|nr:sialin-like [Lytechinus variegatus]XP_041462130.1 sialin-like [Lytechinus variegatus]XP_041462131.1 sialin-like [Lytechinus variegatus]XP_041462132.1 sialin-like [Lytechinus variegatus]
MAVKILYPNSRILFALMCFWGVANFNTLRINPSVAITAMAASNHGSSNSTSDHNETNHGCLNRNEDAEGNHTDNITPEFSWSSQTQELLLSAFFIGLPITQLPGGWIADRVGGKWVVATGAAMTAIMNILVPVAARTGASYFFVVRLLAGIFEGAVVPAMFRLISNWTTNKTKTRVTSFAMAGNPFGLAIGQIVSGFICSTPQLGWPFSFYILGSSYLTWAILWVLIIRESPIKTKENLEVGGQSEKKESEKDSQITKPPATVPVRDLLTSLPVYSFILIRFGIQGWVVGTLLTNLPIYMKYVLGFSIREIGLLASIPYVCQTIISMMTSQVADSLIGRNISVTLIRKAMMCFGVVIIVATLLPVSFIGCNRFLGLGLIVVAATGTGITYPSIFSNAVDLAPRFSGTLMGLANTVALSASFISPIVTGYLVTDQSDPEQWRDVFYIASGIAVFVTIFFQIFGSGEEQAWAKDHEKEDEKYTDKCIHVSHISTNAVSYVVPTKNDYQKEGLEEGCHSNPSLDVGLDL